MKIKTSISTIYRAEVAVPNTVSDAFKHEKEYEMFSYTASRLVEHSGQDCYSNTIEWGESPDKKACEAFVAAWVAQINIWSQDLEGSK